MRAYFVVRPLVQKEKKKKHEPILSVETGQNQESNSSIKLSIEWISIDQGH